MEMDTFVRKPFTVEAIQITAENMKELAPSIGELRHYKGKPFIEVNRKKVPVLSEVEIGYWMTKVDGKVRCYSDKVFREQFTPMTPEIDGWMKFLNNNKPWDAVPTEEGAEEEETVTSG